MNLTADGARIPRRWSVVGWAILAASGLMLALATVAGPPPGAATGGRGVTLVVHLPDPLVATIFGLFALASLLFLAVLLPHGWRRRRKEDEEFQIYHEPPKLSPWAMAVLLALILLPFGLIAYLLWLGWSPGWGGGGAAPHSGGSSVLAPPPPPPVLVKPSAAAPFFGGTVAFLGLAAALGSLGLMLWIFLGDWIARWWAGPLPDHPTPAPLLEAVEESLDDLGREPDPRRAIILCYRRFEQVLARSGVPRAPWETAVEFMREALSRLPLPSEAVRTLTGLFEVSKFSHHPVGSREREAVWDSLVQIKTVLDRSSSRGSAA